MLRTRLTLGLLPLLLLLIAMGGYALFTCLELSRSVEITLVGNYRSMLATEEMKNAATLMNSALYQAQGGDVLAARERFAAQRARFDRTLHEQSMTAAGTPRAGPVEAVDGAFLAQVKTDEAFLREGTLSPLACIARRPRRRCSPRSGRSRPWRSTITAPCRPSWPGPDRPPA